MPRRFHRKRDARKVAEQVLLFLAAGYGLSSAYLPRHQKRITRLIPPLLKDIERRFFQREIRRLYQRKLIHAVVRKEGHSEIVLTKEGKKRARQIGAKNLRVEIPKRWDGRWRVIFYDVPERIRKGRNLLRRQLKALGFRELQRSVWVIPYPCKEAVAYLAEAYDLEDHLHYGTYQSEISEGKLRELFPGL